MAFRKYQKVENQEVLSPEQHDKISKSLKKVGKTSMRDLDEDQRRQVSDALEDDANSTSR